MRLGLCFCFAISYGVWLELRFVASRCGAVPVSCLRYRSRCSAVPVLVHPVVNPRIWTLRHASGNMDLLAGSQMWTPETWVLHIGSTDNKDAEA